MVQSWKSQKNSKLLRKEVIQPHLPIGLPCYDLVLLTNHTFDALFRLRLEEQLRVQPTRMT